MAINEVTSIDVKTLPPFKRLIMTLGELPTSYLESMTYAELLMWFCNFLQEKVLPTIDNNADALQDVITYLENLDLQDEVDHKLDEMTESGQLQEIVADYLNSKAVFGYDTVAGMKSATNLIDGSYAKTLGYHTKNDGGMATYKIRKITNEDIVNEMNIIALNDETLIAELITTNYINVEQLGGKKDDENFDNSSAISFGLDLITDHNKSLVFGNGTYYVSNGITKTRIAECEITGNFNSIINFSGNGYFISSPVINNVKFSNFKIIGNSTNYGFDFGETTNTQMILDNVRMDYLVRYVNLQRPAYVFLYNCNFFFRNTCEYVLQIGKPDTRWGSELVTIDNCIFGGGESLTSTGDILKINQISTLTVNNTDFANTLGHWIVFDTTSNGDIYDVNFNNCSFTRAKQGIEFNLVTNKFLNNIKFINCNVSLNGNWSDGEAYIFNVNRTQGAIQNSLIENISITNINSTYHPEFIYKDTSSSSYIDITVLRKPTTSDKYKITGVQGTKIASTITYGSNVSGNSFNNYLFKSTNICTLTGNLVTSAQIAAYSTLASGLINPFTGVNACIIGYDDAGNVYPLYIESGILKNRRTIPTSTTLRINATYYVNYNSI